MNRHSTGSRLRPVSTAGQALIQRVADARGHKFLPLASSPAASTRYASRLMPEFVWTGIGGLAALLTSFGFLPQVLRMWRRRSVGDVSVVTFIQFTFGVILWTLYGFYIQDRVVVVANLVTLLTLIAGLLSYWRFRGNPPTAAIHEAVRAAAAPAEGLDSRQRRG